MLVYRYSVAMEERECSDSSDSVSWYCPQCFIRKSIRDGSFFSNSRLSLQKLLLIMYLWARQYPVTDAMEEAVVDKRTAIDIYQWLREVCTTKLLSSPIILGGPGVVVQIDESLFRHKPKVNEMKDLVHKLKLIFCQFKHHRGRPTTEKIWVFGLVDTSQIPALGYMEIVPQRDAATLLPLINAHVAPGTIIHSDEWAAYNRVQRLSNVSSHDVVNHSVNFVEPSTGVCTQHEESYWNRVKTKLKRMKGCHCHQLPSYQDEFMWRERYGTSTLLALQNIMMDIAVQYPV